jgi:hypothetical protein|tara:strand:+ start:71 stop:370 length:300 start_codon:yes stop_codon:yes gene_type:complete
MAFNKENYRAETCYLTGKLIYKYIEISTGKKVTSLTQNQKSKVKRACIFNPIAREIKLTAVGKNAKGINPEYYNHFDSHLICRNPATILKNYSIKNICN